MPKYKLLSEDYTVSGQFSPPNPYGHDNSVGKYVEGGDDQDMERELQARITTNPIKAIDEDVADINNILAQQNIDILTFIKTIAYKLGYNSNVTLLGSGAQGFAADIGHNMVLKVTSDKSEAAESMKLVGKRNHYLGDVFKVYKLDAPYNNMFVIVREKLDVNPEKARPYFSHFRDFLTRMGIKFMGGLQDYLADIIDKRDIDEVQSLVTSASNIPDKTEQNQVMNVIYMLDEIIENGIRSADIHENNIGFKPNGYLAFYDLGFSDTDTSGSFDSLKLEEKQQLDEWTDDILKTLNDNNITLEAFAVKTAERLGYGYEAFLGEGAFGFAYKIGPNLVMKITSDKSEAIEAIKLKGKQNNYIGNFYNVYDFDEPYKGIYIILREELDNHTSKVLEYINHFDKFLEDKGLVGIFFARETVRDGNMEKFKTFLEGNKDAINSDLIVKNFVNIMYELLKNGVKSPDFHEGNFGFKKNGVMAYYDVGASANNNTNPEFTRLAAVNERVKTFMPNSKSVEVKEKCKIGGNGDGTSTACNQGDIENIILKEVVNENVNELNAYHGTSNNFKAFSLKKIGTADGRMIGGWGLYFTDDERVASIYGNKIMNVELKDGRYLDFDDVMDDQLVSFILRRGTTNGLSPKNLGQFETDFNDEGYRYDITNRQLYDWLAGCLGSEKNASLFVRKAGFIGNTMTDKTNPDARNYIVFDPSDVKIVDGMYESVLTEAKAEKVQFGALMLKFNISNWDEITSIIDKDDIYDEPTFGIEKEPHVTVLYGFHDEVKSEEVDEIVRKIHNPKKPIEVELTKVSFFEVKAQEYDVVKFNVESPVLGELNTALRKLPHTSAHSTYNAHMTISYVKKGCAQKYEKNLKKSIKLQSDSLVFSTKSKKKTVLNENNQQIPVNSLPFKTEIEQSGGKIYSVGGAVRDSILNKPSKDLDLLVTGIPMDKLEEILAKYGRVDNVGKSFGVIKFNDPKLGELDIAIPRTEKANGQGGYQGFDVSSDHTLPIEKDLDRRDFTINAIAKDANGKLIDPYNGQADLNNKLIRMVNPQAFKDDPLRMIRAVQFAARFGFTIEPETMNAIKQNASRIQEISPERILIEFDKIVKKGSPAVGAKLLVESGLYKFIFGKDNQLNFTEMEKVKTMGEFIYLLGAGAVPSPSEFYKNKLKGDLDTFNEVKAYEMAYSKPVKGDDVQTKLTIFGMFKTYPKSLESAIIPHAIKENISQMQKSGMPFSMKELQVNGNDLLGMGYTGVQIGELLKNLVIDIYGGKLKNNRDLLLRYLTPNMEQDGNI